MNNILTVQETNTHKMIAAQALISLINDFDVNESDAMKANLAKLDELAQTFKDGSIAPDYGTVGVDRDYSLYQDHFYDLDSDDNFTNYFPYSVIKVTDTAESQARNYFGQAIAKWCDGNYTDAVYDLGKAVHYMSDINEPHHAANVPAGINSPHSPFEKLAEKVKYDYKIETLGCTTKGVDYAFGANKEYVTDFVTTLANECGRFAKDMYSSHAKMSNTTEDWKYAIDNCIKRTQRAIAILIYRFLKEVTEKPVKSKPQVISKFHAVINTANEKYAGTDDYIYVGMEFNDGRIAEFNCDLLGNDFEQGYNTSYQFCISDETFDINEVKRVFLRKDNLLLGDDWGVKSLAVYVKGKRIVNKEIGWLSGNTTYSIPVKEVWQ